MACLLRFKELVECEDIFLYHDDFCYLLEVGTAKQMDGVMNGLEIIAYPMMIEEPGDGAGYILDFNGRGYQCSVQNAGIDKDHFRIYRLHAIIDDPKFWD